jgi:peptidoglycan/LPS O-acetylase OafA/YrhL
LRIFPLYYLVILLAAIVGFSDVRRNFWWYVTYTVNYYGLVTNEGIGLPHFWTLALEEQFYLTWPILILLIPRQGLLLVPLAAILVAVITRAVIVVFHLNWMSLMLTPVCLDTLGLGALLAVCSDLRLNRVMSLLEKAGIWVGLPLLIALKITGNFGVLGGLGIIIFNIAVGLFSVWMITRAIKRFGGVIGWILDRRSLRYLGTVSYGLYVYHLPVMMIVLRRWRLVGMPNSPLLKAIVCGGLTVVIASLSWFLFERPINGLKRWFPYRLTGHYKPHLALST